jgi:UDP-4-amino-4-deoxy-L-arabinose formyltransferase/UDP-glucuronic acid dehydrogenase (UDP-4-keto-hexauronic acid decarboxylating)
MVPPASAAHAGSMKVALAAEDAAGILTLRMLQQRGHEVELVLARPAREQAQGGTVWDVAQLAGLRTVDSRRLTDPSFGNVLRDHDIDVFLNVSSPVVVHANVLHGARLGSFNVHPGPLPAYAGLHPVSWAIYNGERSHGIALHHMEAQVCAGDIVYQETFPIADVDTGLTVSSRCARTGVQLVVRLLGALELDPASVPRAAQDLTARTWFGASVPRGGRLEWDASAAMIVDFVRACDYYPLPSPWDLPSAMLAGHAVGVAKAARTYMVTHEPPGTVRADGGSNVHVACADEWVSVVQVRLAGKRCSPLAVLDRDEVALERAR